MSNPQNVRTVADSPEAAPGATTTFVRADPRPSAEGYADLHPQLRAQLRELQLRTGTATPDVGLLLRLVNEHYQRIETERRGIAESMRLMADEARALEHTAREQGSEHLQVILDHIKDVVLSVEEDGTLRTFNPTGERVFGYTEAEVVGQRIELLIPEITIAESETVPEALQRLAASTGDTALDLAGRELWARRKDGESFPAEIAVSKAPLARREMFVLCLRNVTERRESEQAMRESAARYRLLVDHAPEAIVVLDVDTGRFMDANDKAQKLFGLDRAKLLEVGPVTLSPPYQPDGGASEQRARAYIQQALEGETPAFEWTHLDGPGREIICEVRLARLPSGKRRLVRGSIADISERKRAERMASAEHRVF
ncbi:MAG: PAS domain S-box protein, partial [Gammaproteobacteria bacterium]